MADMFTYQSEEVILFKSMYENADQSPILVKEVMLGDEDFWDVGVSTIDTNPSVFPNPVTCWH